MGLSYFVKVAVVQHSTYGGQVDVVQELEACVAHFISFIASMCLGLVCVLELLVVKLQV